jgi:glutathione S-transferase
MAELTIYLGNKNYSSWSLRPWLALKHTGAAFDETMIPLYDAPSKAAILAHSPSGKVPCLIDGTVTVWESLPICEYLAEAFPAARLWPAERAARAVARAVSGEMHAGFRALRQALPMNIRAHRPGHAVLAEARADIDRVTALWRDCRGRFGAGGDFLFGDFTIADAMYAPVVSRFVTYGVALDRAAAAYCEAVTALPAMQDWIAAAKAEPTVIPAFEF